MGCPMGSWIWAVDGSTPAWTGFDEVTCRVLITEHFFVDLKQKASKLFEYMRFCSILPMKCNMSKGMLTQLV